MKHSGACLINKNIFVQIYFKFNQTRVKTKFKINKEAVELGEYGNHFNDHNHHVLPAQSYVSYPVVSLSMAGSLGKDVFERRTSTGSGLFRFLNSCYAQVFRGIVFMRVQTLSNTQLLASRYIKREIVSLSVDVRCQKRLCLNSLMCAPTSTRGLFA